MIKRLKQFFNRKFNPNYKAKEALTKYLGDYFANSEYFNFKEIGFSKTGFSMILNYKTITGQSEHITQIKPFGEYFSEVYKNYFEACLNINDRVERMMNNLESRIKKSFYLNGGLNTQWVI